MSPKRQEQSQGRQPRFLIYCQKLALLITQLLLPAVRAVWLRAALFRADPPRTQPGSAGRLPAPRAVPGSPAHGQGLAGELQAIPTHLPGGWLV